jgi:hypothetical protein
VVNSVVPVGRRCNSEMISSASFLVPQAGLFGRRFGTISSLSPSRRFWTSSIVDYWICSSSRTFPLIPTCSRHTYCALIPAYSGPVLLRQFLFLRAPCCCAKLLLIQASRFCQNPAYSCLVLLPKSCLFMPRVVAKILLIQAPRFCANFSCYRPFPFLPLGRMVVSCPL